MASSLQAIVATGVGLLALVVVFSVFLSFPLAIPLAVGVVLGVVALIRQLGPRERSASRITRG